jgi:hypothetical protein
LDRKSSEIEVGFILTPAPEEQTERPPDQAEYRQSDFFAGGRIGQDHPQEQPDANPQELLPLIRVEFFSKPPA